MEVNEVFLLRANSQSSMITTTLSAFFNYLKGEEPYPYEVVKGMWNTFFLVIPVVSTTFSSVERMFHAFKPQDIPWLFIDEAGQAVPQAAAGAIWRSRRVVVVGDPFQIEPVVTIPVPLNDNICNYFELTTAQVHSTLSVQSMADRTNRYGQTINETWVGSPLRVHRRCLGAMFEIANDIAYEGIMLNCTLPPEQVNINFKTQFIHCPGQLTGKHYVKEQKEVIKKLLLEEIDHSKGFPDLFVISPFGEIPYRLKKELEDDIRIQVSRYRPVSESEVKQWTESHIGTVHTFQGKQAEGVIFCLGLDHSAKGAADWAASKPNLLNVALTRAKYRFIAVGDKSLWLKQRYFEELVRLDEEK